MPNPCFVFLIPMMVVILGADIIEKVDPREVRPLKFARGRHKRSRRRRRSCQF